MDLRRSLIALACVVAVFAVFAAFFEIGRVTRSTHTLPQAYGPPKLPAVFVRAGIPQGLVAAPAIPTLVAGEAHRTQAPAKSTSVGGASASTPETATSPVTPTGTSPASSSPSSTTPAVTPAPVKAPQPSAPVAKPHGGSPGGEGGSFDSSG